MIHDVTWWYTMIHDDTQWYMRIQRWCMVILTWYRDWWLLKWHMVRHEEKHDTNCDRWGTVEHNIDLYHENDQNERWLSDLGNNLTLVGYQTLSVSAGLQFNANKHMVCTNVYFYHQAVHLYSFFKKRLTIFNHFMIFYDKIVWTVSLGWESTD